MPRPVQPVDKPLVRTSLQAVIRLFSGRIAKLMISMCQRCGMWSLRTVLRTTNLASLGICGIRRNKGKKLCLTSDALVPWYVETVRGNVSVGVVGLWYRLTIVGFTLGLWSSARLISGPVVLGTLRKCTNEPGVIPT